MIGLRDVFLAVMTAWDPGIAGTKTLRYATHSMETNPADTPAHTIIEPFLVEPPSVSVQLGTDGTVSFSGELLLNNENDALDALRNYTFDGYACYLYYFPIWTEEFYLAGLTGALNKYIMGELEFSDGQIKIALDGLARNADVPLQTSVFGGTGGIDGGSDVVGKTKPFLLGGRNNIPAMLIDPSINLYSISGPVPTAPGVSATGHTSTVGNILDGASAIPKDADYPNLATLLSTAPTVGHARVLQYDVGGNVGIFFRTDTTPANEVTVETATLKPCNQSPSLQVVLDVLANMATGGRANSGGPATASAALGAGGGDNRVGVFYRDGGTFLDAFKKIAADMKAWVQPIFTAHFAAGVFTEEIDWDLGWIEDPTTAPANAIVTDGYGSAALVIQGDSIVSMERVTASQLIATVPAYRLFVDYQPIDLVQTTGLTAGVSASTRAYLANQYRSLKTEDATVLARWPRAREERLAIPLTWLTGGGAAIAAQNWAKKVFPGISVLRELFEVEFKFASDAQGDHSFTEYFNLLRGKIGDPVTIKNYARFGCDVSRKWLILELEPNLAEGMAKALLWG